MRQRVSAIATDLQTSNDFQALNMNYKLLISCVAVVSLQAGCSLPWLGRDKAVDPRTPPVEFDNGKITVPTVIVFPPGEKDVDVTWKLPANSKARFAKDGGIVIEGALTDKLVRGESLSVVLDRAQTEVVCPKAGSADGLSFTCRNKHSKPGVYKYTIRLVDESGKLIELDPSLVNM
jgi:hypothetical protein